MSIEGIKIFIAFVGGLGLFIYGMQTMADGLQNAAGNKMQSLLNVLTTNRFMGVLTGALVTMVIQSSSATTVMVVGFVNAGIMSLTQSVGVIMGANIGTTFTSWIVALSQVSEVIPADASAWTTFLKPTTMAPLAVAIGVVMMLAAKKEKTKMVGSIFVGFGLLFIGITTMSAAVSPLKDSKLFQDMFITLGVNPILGLLAGTIVTCVLQSSSASVGILQSIAVLGLVPWSAAIYIILGQNIGTCITAILSSIGTSKNAKAASYIHLTFNVIGSGVFLILAVIYFTFINPASAMASTSVVDISIFHTVFNVVATVMLFPFGDQLVKIASKLAGLNKEEANSEDTFEPRLDDRLLENPAIAIATSFSEIVRMGEICHSALVVSRDCLTKDDNDQDIASLFKLEQEINILERALTEYMTKIIRMNLSESERTDISGYFHIISDFERIGDHCENVAEMCRYFNDEKLTFSTGARDEIIKLVDTTIVCFNACLDSLKNNDVATAKKAIQLEDDIDILVEQFRNSHIERLTLENCEPKAGIVFLDLLSNYERVSDHSKNISQFVVYSQTK